MQDAFAECLKLREAVLAADPENTGKQMQLAPSQARCGRVEAAARATDTLRSSLYPNPGTLFRLACSYTLCAQALKDGTADIAADGDREALAERYLNAALDALREAVAHGYKDPCELRSHPDLAALRQDAGFDSLLDGLSGHETPAAEGEHGDAS